MKARVKMTDSAKGRINRSLSHISNTLGEKGQGLVDELRGIFDEFEAAEQEISDEELVAKINELVESATKGGSEEIANALASMKNAIAEVKNGINATEKGAKLSQAVKNQICGAMLGCKTKAEVKNAVEKVLVKNEVTGFTFADVIDYAIVDNWGDEQGMYGLLKQVPYTKFFYNDDDLSEANILAKQWDKSSAEAKTVQIIATDGKSISTKYIYKRQKMANEDLDEIAQAGESSNFINYITTELRRQYCNTIIKKIVAGDSTITTFESIGSKTASDLFTTVKNPEGAALVFGDLWKTVLEVKDAANAVVYIDKAAFAAAAGFTYAAGGTEDFRGLDEMKIKLGVKDIILYDLHTYTEDKVHAVVFVPGEYWVKEKGKKEIAYPDYSFNVQNWMYEVNAGGGIHGIKSSAVLREAE